MFEMWVFRDKICWGCGMSEMRDVRDEGYCGRGMFMMWDVGAVGCWGCGMFTI